MIAIEFAPNRFRSLGDDVAASVRENLSANIARILDELAQNGVSQQEIAKALDIKPPVLTRLKKGQYKPSLDRLDEILTALNEFTKVTPEDLFRDPEETKTQRQRAMLDLLEELANRAGYELKPKRT